MLMPRRRLKLGAVTARVSKSKRMRMNKGAEELAWQGLCFSV